MSAKRHATTDLNHDNWDQEDEPEEIGSFQQASEATLKKRVIKKARRSITVLNTESDSNENKQGLFSGFSGFGKSPAAGNSNLTSFLCSLSKPTSSQNITKDPSVKPMFAFTKEEKKVVVPQLIPSNTIKKSEDEKRPEYYEKLKLLNKTVSDWIKMHVDKNPLCILTVIFQEYENYLEEIEKEAKNPTTVQSKETLQESSNTPTSSISSKKPMFSANNKTENNTLKLFSFSNSSSLGATVPSFSFGSKTANTSETKLTPDITKTSIPNHKAISESTKSNGFSFNPKKDNDIPSPAGGFKFVTSSNDSNSKKQQENTGFKFSASTTSFGFNNKNDKPSENAIVNKDDEDVPPEVKFTQVVEDDAVYSKKCKVFVKKDNSFTDRGVGTLYLKPIMETEKTQLLVRADTNLGNILVNCILSADIPVKSMGKNNIMIVYAPTSDATSPRSVLIRVKTAEDAVQLLENIEKYKK